tara:strand:+ start:1777 stop:2556 length:780 start_codon:yes stop_codon:yes gene_type:complete
MIKRLLKFFFAKFDIELNRKSYLDKIFADSVRKKKWEFDIKFTLEFGNKIGPDYLKLLELSKSQTRQDLFVLSELNLKKKGFFVEFGATDGVTFSNTYLLEKEFGYKGILAESNPKQCKNITNNRDAKIENKCVWRESNMKLEFVDVADFSTIKEFSSNDMHSNIRKNKPTFFVETISLTDMLVKHDAPLLIDYLSIDTEGSEFEILSSHNFDQYKFSVITVEHNFTNQREKIFKLLTKKGYKRKYEQLSGQDDWYVLN